MHKLVGVELRLYAAREMQQGGDPGRTGHRICVQQWGWKPGLKMMMVMMTTTTTSATFLGALLGAQPCAISFEWLHFTLQWEGAGLQR